jgi:hypothetical protein
LLGNSQRKGQHKNCQRQQKDDSFHLTPPQECNSGMDSTSSRVTGFPPV